MHEKYKNHVWLDSLELEKSSICEMGSRDMIKNETIIGQRYREFASVPMPRFTTAPHEESFNSDFRALCGGSCSISVRINL